MKNSFLFAKIGGFLLASAALVGVLVRGIDYVVVHDELISNHYQRIWILAFIANVAAVSVPGRFDGDAESKDFVNNWKTLFGAANWTFAIWGIIYLAEALITLYVFFKGTPTSIFKQILPYWLAGHMYQILWCAAFRKDMKTALWLPSILLLGGAVSFGLGVFELTKILEHAKVEPFLLCLTRLPFSIHCGWLVAATILNYHSWLNSSGSSIDLQVQTAYAATYLSCGLALFFLYFLHDPAFTLTIAWALLGVAARTAEGKQLPGELLLTQTKISLHYQQLAASKILALVAGIYMVSKCMKVIK